MNTNADRPLSGIKVVDLSTFVAAPACARMLADMGAEVIKIEGFNGDPWRVTAKVITHTDDLEMPIYDLYNSGKKSIRLNIKHPLGKKALMDMIAQADVFITNIRPASLKKQGLDYETLSKQYPKLVYGMITGYGEKGPEAAKPGFDDVAFWSRSGFLRDMTTDWQYEHPTNTPTSAGDNTSGAMLFGGIMTSLFKRERTGKGDLVTVALYNAGIWLLGSMIAASNPKYGSKFPKTRADFSPFSSFYRCSDGEWVRLTVLEYLRYRDILLDALGITEKTSHLDLSTYAKMRETPELGIIMEEAFAKKPANVWVEELTKRDVTCCRVNHMCEVLTDEQAIVNGFVNECRYPNGSVEMVAAPPIRIASQPIPKTEVAANPGDNTREVQEALGYSSDYIDEMISEQAAK